MRTIRDEDRDSSRDRGTVAIDDVTCVRASANAILVRIDGAEHWIPQSQVHAESEVYGAGHEGRLVITRWIADQKGLG